MESLPEVENRIVAFFRRLWENFFGGIGVYDIVGIVTLSLGVGAVLDTTHGTHVYVAQRFLPEEFFNYAIGAYAFVMFATAFASWRWAPSLPGLALLITPIYIHIGTEIIRLFDGTGSLAALGFQFAFLGAIALIFKLYERIAELEARIASLLCQDGEPGPENIKET